MKKIMTALTLSVLCAVMAFAADFNGKWKATFEMQGQTRENMMEFKVDGDKVTGTISSQRGESKIEDGKVTGDTIEFNVTRNFGGNSMKMNYKGKMTGSEIKFNVGTGERSFEMTAKRAET
ncbi:MAG: hypothetical protein ACRD8O_10245 [Bryobacteraceae bacterium]